MCFTDTKILALCALLFLSSSVLTSCGQKGALYIQQAEQQEQQDKQRTAEKP